jgi:chemotaxis protein CheX
VENPDDLVGPFSEAVAAALRELAGVESILTEAHSTAEPVGFGDVSAILRLNGEGFLVLSLPAPTAASLARRVLAETLSEVADDMVRDCMGEVANIIAGQAKTLFYGTRRHFTFTTPTVVNGPPSVQNAQRWVATFHSDVGEFTLHVRMPE